MGCAALVSAHEKGLLLYRRLRRGNRQDAVLSRQERWHLRGLKTTVEGGQYV